MTKDFAIVVAIALVIAACGTAAGPVTTSSPPQTDTTTTTTSPPITESPSDGLPIEDDWAEVEILWGVRPACCGQPAAGPASPAAPIPGPDVNPDGWASNAVWPADGFYDATVTRVWDPPGVLQLSMRRWVPCLQLPERCPPDSPADGIVSDPASEVVATVFFDALTVVIQPLQEWKDGMPPDPPIGITGSGRAFYELLVGWCEGTPTPGQNCGVDHAFADWIGDPYRAGASAAEIIDELETRGADPGFPLGIYDDGSSDAPCSDGRICPPAYRGPHGTNLIADVQRMDAGEDWLSQLYGWWTTLEIRDGRPILYIDAGQIAG